MHSAELPWSNYHYKTYLHACVIVPLSLAADHMQLAELTGVPAAVYYAPERVHSAPAPGASSYGHPWQMISQPADQAPRLASLGEKLLFIVYDYHNRVTCTIPADFQRHFELYYIST